MEFADFSIQLATQLASSSPVQRIAFGLDICRRLYPDYIHFHQEYQWGDPSVLKRAIDYVSQSMGAATDEDILNGLMDELDLAIPDTEEFGDFATSYAINSACAVWELLEYLLDQDQTHLMHMSTLATETIDFKLQEADETLTADELSKHPALFKEWEYQIEITR